MNFKITIESNNYLNSFFKKYKIFTEDIIKNINTVLPHYLEKVPSKIKTVNKTKHNGLIIQEYKIVLSTKNFRGAFTVDTDSNVNLFYISDMVIKREFVKAIENTHLIDKK